jgi:hypothetical protein
MDLGFHLALAFLLPGPGWLQFLPDAMLPLLWPVGMLTDSFMRPDGAALVLHRLLHLRGRWAMPAMCAVLLAGVAWPSLAAHWLAHVAVDSLTHDGKEWL